MRYAKKRDSDTDWQLEDDRAQERLLRVRRREMPLSPRVTRKMTKVDAALLAAATRDAPRFSSAPTAPPPGARAAVQPPPLAILPFANTASATFAMTNEQDLVGAQESWVLPPTRPSMLPRELTLIPKSASESMVPREPDPFSLIPPR
jgi:hypothetical protein